jgi:hypothetical protein
MQAQARLLPCIAAQPVCGRPASPSVAVQPVQDQALQAHCCVQVFVLGGSWSGPKDLSKDAELFDPTLGTWSSLPGIQAAFILTADPQDKTEGFSYRGDNYGMFHSWSDGTGNEWLSCCCVVVVVVVLLRCFDLLGVARDAQCEAPVQVLILLVPERICMF